jgi:F-type H+-transporting ATPase subunit gamma
VVAVGRKLWSRLDEALPGFTPLVGASVSEELPSTLSQIVADTHRQLTEQEATSLRLIYHGDEQGTIRTRRLLPPEPDALIASQTSPPLLQLSPEDYFSDFLHHYLYLGLTEIFSVSLLAENHYRVQHLEGAVRRLDERLEDLGRRARALRQEEITEEIETILLGTGGV